MLTQVLKHYPLILILIFATILLSINLNKPFIGHHDWNGVWYSNFARNFTKYGLLKTKVGSVMNYDNTGGKSFQYATHYPPLMPIFIFLSFTIFGIHEWSARLVPMISTLATITLIYVLSLKFFDKRVAVFACAFTSVLPITIYFGKMPVHEIVVIPFILLSVFFYFNYRKQQSLQNLSLLILALVLSHLIHWSGYFLTPLFSLHWLITSHKKEFYRSLIFPTVSIALFALHLAHLYWLTGSPTGGGLVQILTDRLNITDSPEGLTPLNFARTQVINATAYFTKSLLFLSTITLIWIIIQVRRKSINKKVQLLIMLAIFGATYNLIFRNAAFIHDYTIYYILPFLTITAAYGLFIILDEIKVIPPTAKIVVAVLAVATVAIEKMDFTKALLASSAFQEGVILGKIINQKTVAGEKTLVLSTDFRIYYEVFTAYYADRNIDYVIPDASQINNPVYRSNYKIIIAIPSRDTPTGIIDVLQEQYQKSKIDEFLIYDTQKPKS